MKQIKFFIGTDVSKGWLDMCIVLEGEVLSNERIENKQASISRWLRRTQKQFGYVMGNALFAMEFTGIYNHHLLEVLHAAGAHIWLISGIEINASRGLERSKNDRQDAKLIAEYAMKNLKKVRLFKKPRTAVKKLSALLMMREKLITSKHGYSVTGKEYKSFSRKEEYLIIKEYSAVMLRTIDKELKKIEEEIKYLIKGDERLFALNEYISSVDGVGLITSALMMRDKNSERNATEIK